MRPLVVLLLTTAFLLAGCLTFGDREHPSDDELLAAFSEHESEFETLRQMCVEDSNMVRIAPDFLWTVHSAAWPKPEPEWGITRGRWDGYKALFGKLGLRSGIDNDQPDFILLLANCRGLVTGGTCKGFAYLSKPVATRDSLDNFDWKTARPDEKTFFRHIKGNWYLYFGG